MTTKKVSKIFLKFGGKNPQVYLIIIRDDLKTTPSAFHFVEWSLYFVYIFRMGLNFLIKFCSPDPRFNRIILKSLYLKFKTSAHAHIANACYYAFFTNFLT